jgi:putative ATP-dependent endonuclease of the OLD family
LPEEDHPPTQVQDGYAVIGDTLETLLSAEWPAWEQTAKDLVAVGRGVAGKNAATYRLAAIEAAAGPPHVLTMIIQRAKALCPEG